MGHGVPDDSDQMRHIYLNGGEIVSVRVVFERNCVLGAILANHIADSTIRISWPNCGTFTTRRDFAATNKDA